MKGSEVVWIAIVIGAAAAVFAWLRWRRAGATPGADSGAATALASAMQAPVEPAPTRLVIGESEDRAALTLRASDDAAAFERAKPVPSDNGVAGRMLSLLQAAPNVLIAGQSAGKRLMEVSIKGDLVRAADGSGFRPFSVLDGKINEQAKLFDAGKLQSVVNAAAIWQVASVIVAQKHLADINEKLADIKKAVEGISRFLAQERASRLQATYDYLQQGAKALSRGELSPSVRIELEACERDLIAIFDSMAREFEDKLGDEIPKSTYAFSSSDDYFETMKAKIAALSDLAAGMEHCLRTRIGAWRMLSVYPGEPHLVESRRESIEKAGARLAELETKMRDGLPSEIAALDGLWAFSSTLDERRSQLTREKKAGVATLAMGALHKATVAIDAQRLLEHDKATVLYCSVEDGKLVELRMAT